MAFPKLASLIEILSCVILFSPFDGHKHGWRQSKSSDDSDGLFSSTAVAKVEVLCYHINAKCTSLNKRVTHRQRHNAHPCTCIGNEGYLCPLPWLLTILCLQLFHLLKVEIVASWFSIDTPCHFLFQRLKNTLK